MGIVATLTTAHPSTISKSNKTSNTAKPESAHPMINVRNAPTANNSRKSGFAARAFEMSRKSASSDSVLLSLVMCFRPKCLRSQSIICHLVRSRIAEPFDTLGRVELFPRSPPRPILPNASCLSPLTGELLLSIRAVQRFARGLRFVWLTPSIHSTWPYLQ